MNTATTILPAEIQKLIVKVTRRTRLRKTERADIERELTAHFRDGLDAGKSVAQLIEAFGEAKVSAKTIRAGAIAKRPPLDRVLRQLRIAVGWTFTACIVFYVGSLGYLWMQSPVITFDPIERFHASLPKVAEHDRAWPIYKQGLLALADPFTQPFPNEPMSFRLVYKSFGKQWGRALPNDPDWATQRAVMMARRGGIDTIVLATTRPYLGYVPDDHKHAEDADIYDFIPGTNLTLYDQKYASDRPISVPMLQLYVPFLGVLPDASDLLATDALMAIEDGDGARFVRNINAILRLAQHTEETKMLGAQRSGKGIRCKAFEQITMALEWRPDALSDEQLKQLATTLRAIPADKYELDLAMERLSMEDNLQRIFSDNHAGDGVFNVLYGEPIVEEVTKHKPGYWKPRAKTQFNVWQGNYHANTFSHPLFGPAVAAAFASRKETSDLFNTMYTQVEEQTKHPLWQQDDYFRNDYEKLLHANATNLDPNSANKAKWLLVRALAPDLEYDVKKGRMCEGESMAAQVGIALTQYRRAHGGVWPATIDELVPTYLAAVPLDPWNGEPINYQVREGRAYVWSVGPDRHSHNRDDELHYPDWWDNGGRYQDWLWFLSDDKLLRWIPQK